MNKKYLLTTTVAVIIAGVAVWAYMPSKNTQTMTHAKFVFKPANNTSPVAARINGKEVTVAEIRKGYDSNPQIAEQVPFEEFYPKALDIFVNGELLYQAAQKAHIESTPAYKEELNTAQKDVARKVYLETVVAQKVTDEAINKFYQDEYVSKFKSKKEVKAKHILLDSEKDANMVLEKLKKGAKFEDVAKKHTKDNAVDLGYFTEDIMVPEFTKAAMALKKGEYTKKPVKTQFGYHIILVEDIRDSSPLPVEELAPQIKNILSQKAVAETFDELYQNGKVERFDLEGKLIKQEPEE